MSPRLTRRSLMKIASLTALGGGLTLGLPGQADAQVRRRRVPYVDLAVTPSGRGLWTLDRRGRITAHGDAVDLADPPDPISDPPEMEQFVALASLPSGVGFYALTRRGGIRGFGDARALDGIEISETIPCVMPMPFVDFVLTPSGNGLWALDRLGDVVAIGDAQPFVDPPDPVKEQFVALASLPAGLDLNAGVYALSRRGHVRGFGDARALDGTEISEVIPCVMPVPFADFAVTPSGNGLWVLDQLGGLFAIGDAPRLADPPDPVKELFVGLEATPSGAGLFALSQHGDIVMYGDANLAIPCI